MNEVFVVDDSASVLVAIERMLVSHGYSVTTERSGVGALAYLQDHCPDLVICDLVLPDLDGTEICSYLHRRNNGSAPPVIAISGMVDDRVLGSALRAGAVSVLRKPFNAEDLLREIKLRLEEGSGAADIGVAARAPLPSPAEDPAVREQLQDLIKLPAFRFAFLLQIDGTAVERIGTCPSDVPEAAKALALIAQQSASTAEWLGQTDPHQIILEADDGFIVSQRCGPGHLVVLVLEDQSVLGMTRLALARLRRVSDNSLS